MITMERLHDTPPAQETVLSGKDLADTLYRQELETAATIGDVREKMDNLLNEVGTDGKAGERMSEIKDGLEEATGNGNDNVKLEQDLGSGVLGQNKVGTKESVMRMDQLDPEQVTAEARYTLDTVLHENSEALGHAGQDPSAAATVEVIDAAGKHHDAVTVFEGNVVENVASELGKRREGLPQETYLDGADLVKDLGRGTVDSYVRKGGANVGKHLQEEVWRQQGGKIDVETMLEQGAAVGMSREQVLRAAREQGKEVPQGAGLALAA